MQMTDTGAITGRIAISSTTGITVIMGIIMAGTRAMDSIMAGITAIDSIISNTTITIIFMAIAGTRTTMGPPIAPGITMA
jgi:hypothetical protein